MHTDDSACELPVFGNPRIALDYRELKYNPCNDVIFPSLLRAADSLRRPLATWYMYYAPHNAPGGICLATAPSLKGPCTDSRRSNGWNSCSKLGERFETRLKPERNKDKDSF